MLTVYVPAPTEEQLRALDAAKGMPEGWPDYRIRHLNADRIVFVNADLSVEAFSVVHCGGFSCVHCDASTSDTRCGLFFGCPARAGSYLSKEAP